MNRKKRTQAIILKSRRFRDADKYITVLSPDLGIIDAAVYGAFRGKSRLSGISEPFLLIDIYLYSDPVKEQYKVTDIELLSDYPVLRNSYEAYVFTTLFSEILIKTQGAGGEWNNVFLLLKRYLENLNGCSDPEKIPACFLITLWKFILTTGYRPNLSECALCGRTLGKNGTIYYNASQNELLCSSCSLTGYLSISPAALLFLGDSTGIPIKGGLELALTGKTRKELYLFLVCYIEAAFEISVNTKLSGKII